MGKPDREKEQDGQWPTDRPLPKGDWVRKDDGGRHSVKQPSGGKQDDDKK
jgi:hypothetical protein